MKLQVLTIGLFFSCMAVAQVKEKVVQSSIESVTVFVNRAQINREAKITLNK